MGASDPRRAIIAERLRTARKMAGLSQGQVARELGLHRPSVSETEAGRRRVSVEELGRLAELYKVDVGWLAGEDQGDGQQERVELAAKELAKLDKEDLDRVLDLLRALRE
jgi:transcriptional regulator with XRE-family HTH domain